MPREDNEHLLENMLYCSGRIASEFFYLTLHQSPCQGHLVSFREVLFDTELFICEIHFNIVSGSGHSSVPTFVYITH